MKKGLLKRFLSLSMAAMLALGLCACGDAEGTGGIGGIGGGTKKDPNAALAKENVYKFQEFELPKIEGDSFDVRSTAHKDGVLYMILQIYNWSSGNGEETKLLTMNSDGSNVKLVELEMPEKDKENDDAVEYPGDASTLPIVPKTETTDSATSGESATEDTTTEDVAEEPSADDMIADFEEIYPEDYSNVWENTYYDRYTVGADGKVYAIKNYYFEDYSDPENYISEQKTYICSWNGDGSFAWETELANYQSDEEWVYISNLTVDANGKVSLLLAGDNAYAMEVTQEKAGEKKALPEDVAAMFVNMAEVITRNDGTMLVIFYDENDWAKMYAATYDPAAGTVSEKMELPAAFGWSGYQTVDAGVSTDLIYSTYNGIYTLNLGETQSKEKMSYINSDMNITSINALVELDEKSFVGVFYENYDGELKAGRFTYVAPEDIPDKSVLVLGGNYVSSDMKQRVVEFNRSSDKYRIVVKNYEQYNSYEDYSAGITQLNNDIITGQMPDILITDGLPVDNYVAKGLFEDIGALLAADEELSKVEYVENVFEAYKVNGKLYYVIPNFNVCTMIGKTSVVGDRTTWTMAEMQELVKSLPEGTEIIGELTRPYFFNMVLQYCGSDFVDVETGKCEFNSQNFIEMMEFAKTLPQELSEDYYGEDFWMSYESRYREGRTVLMGTTIASIQNMNYTINGMFGEDVSFIGFPTMSGQGSYINAYNSYAISSRSLHKEGAWEFLRYYLTEECQAELGWGLPTIKKLFLENAQKATQRPYYLDEEGNKVEYDDYFWMNDEQIKLEPMTQAQVDEIVQFIYSVDKVYYNNEEVRNIINEDMEAFYTGQKTAQDVANIIQSRVQLYVDENR